MQVVWEPVLFLGGGDVCTEKDKERPEALSQTNVDCQHLSKAELEVDERRERQSLHSEIARTRNTTK